MIAPVMNATNALMDEALRLAALGWRVFPLGPGRKTPWPGSRGVKDATTDGAMIERWWTQVPNSNIGLAMGGGAIAVDVDPGAIEAHGAERIAEIELDSAGAPKQSTPRGGFHLFHRLPPGVTARNSAGAIGVGFDTRADGGYVVAAPRGGAMILTCEDGLAENAARALFSGDVSSLDETTINEVFADVPSSEHAITDLAGAGVLLVELLPSTSLAQSKREAREFLSNGAITINGAKAHLETTLSESDLLHGSVALLRRGKKPGASRAGPDQPSRSRPGPADHV